MVLNPSLCCARTCRTHAKLGLCPSKLRGDGRENEGERPSTWLKDAKSHTTISEDDVETVAGRGTVGAPEGAKGISLSIGLPLKKVKVLAKRWKFQLLSGDGAVRFIWN